MPALLPAVVAGAAAGLGAVLTTTATTGLFGVFLGAAMPAFASATIMPYGGKFRARKGCL